MNHLSSTTSHSAKGSLPAGKRGWAHTDPQQKFFVLADGIGPLAALSQAAQEAHRVLPSIQQYRLPFRKGDILLACSNDLCAQMPDPQIAAMLLRANGAQHLLGRLTEAYPQTPLIVALHQDDAVTAPSGRHFPVRTEWSPMCRSYA